MNCVTRANRARIVSIALLSCGLGIGVGHAVAEVVPPGTEDEIRERTQPDGRLCRAGSACGGMPAVVADTTASTGMSGEQIYNQFCFACHATGVSGAPLLGDVAAWEPRIAKGMDVLMANTVNGINVMPPKGTCIACSDAELQETVDYMIGAAP